MAGTLYFRVDEKAIQKKLREQLVKRTDVQAKATSAVSNLFARVHSSLMREFFEHKITLELRADPTASNISDTLNGEGNLFAFLGFYDGQDPTWDLEELLSNISFRKSSVRNGAINFQIINIPTKTNIKDATKMNWGNGSWALGVEDGDFKGGADLAHFIFKSWSGSRSKEGFQVKGYEYSEEKFSPRPYISKMLENFRDRVNNSTSKFLV
jgi:hypothetical protein